MAQPLVLIVDDVEDNREVYVQFLRHLGLDVVEAPDGATALASAVRRAPDIVVTDLGLPGMDGFELCRRLRSDPRTSGVPVIVVTGYPVAEAAAQARAAGCTRFLVKPCLPEVLHAEIRRLLDYRLSAPA